MSVRRPAGGDHAQGLELEGSLKGPSSRAEEFEFSAFARIARYAASDCSSCL